MFQIDGDVDPLPDGYQAAIYIPVQFMLGASLAQVEAVLVDFPLVSIESSDSVWEGLELYAGEQLLLGFQHNRLFYVDAIAYVPEGGE